MSGIGRRQAAFLAVCAIATAIAAILNYSDADAVAIFIVSAIALAGIAWVVAFATEALGARFGPAVTGVLQSTLGNLPEFFVVLFALGAGETLVAQISLVGSILANALLVLGVTIVVGARASDDGVMRFHPRLPNDTATLMMLAVAVIVVLGVATSSGDIPADRATAVSVIGSVCLLVVYGLWLTSYLRADTTTSTGGEPAEANVPLRTAIVLLAIGGVAAALVSDWFIGALDPAVASLGISRAFAGLVIVAIAGNAVENTTALILARKGQSDLAISVVKNSVAQIAAFLFPALVIVSLLFESHLTFVLSGVYTATMALTALAVWQISGDGEARIYEGAALVSLYVIVAAVALYE